MKTKELFIVGGPSQSFDGRSPFLDQNNCQIVNKTKQDDAVVLSLKRESDSEEGRASMRVRPEYLDPRDQLLTWAFLAPGIIGLTINQLNELETGFEITTFAGRSQLQQGAKE